MWERLTPELTCSETIVNYFSDALENGRERKRHPVAKHPKPCANAVLHLVDYLATFPVEQRDQQFQAVEEKSALDLSECITDGIFQLTEDKPEDAIRAGEVLAVLPDFPSIQNEVTIALAYAGHREHAFRRVRAGLEAFPDGYPEYCIAAEVHNVFGEDEKALELLNKARGLVEDALDVAIVDSQIAAIEGERNQQKNIDTEFVLPDPIEPERPTTPLKYDPSERQTGPNERCTCGSGKKYKKCCGRLV